MTILLIIILLLLVFLCKRKKENFQESLVHYPIYWINLDRSKDRKIWIEKNFKKLGITKHKRIQAVDGNKLRVYNLNIPQEYYNTHSNNEIAWTSSHWKCIEQAYNNRDNISIICEDDVCFSLLKAVDKSLQEIINKCPRDWEIIQLGINKEKLRLRPHGKDELAHYSSACFDVEYEFPFGWSELEGIADRGTFDLDQHIEHSKKKLNYFDPKTNIRYVPAVVESSAGVDRTFLTCLVDAYTEEEVQGEKRVLLILDPSIAPTTCAVFPLVNKNGLPEIAEKIVGDLRKHFSSFFDQGGSIGRRYRRQDEAGTPFGVTVDHETIENGTVTIRERDSMEQIRISQEKVSETLIEKMNF